MDLDTILASASDSQSLKCFVCENYLTHFPISVCSNKRSICGRCALPEGITSLHDVAFETVAQGLRFPCRYKSVGCFEALQPKDVPQHEENCPFKIVKCIVNEPERCEWSGPLPTLTDHCRKEHSNIFLRSQQFEMNLTQSLESQHLMEVDDKLLIFCKSFDFESKILTCAVYLNEYETDVETYGCRLTVSSGKATISYDFDATSFDEKRCEAVGLLFVGNDNATQDLVTAKISFLRKKEIVNENGELENKSKNSKMRDLLQCSDCDTLAGPSMFRDAESMNVLCADCNSFSTESSENIEQSTPKEDKIFSSFAALLTYPCKFQEYGCIYMTHLEGVKNHEDFCRYRRELCMFQDCLWEGFRRDLDNHLLQKHSQEIIDLELLGETIVSKDDINRNIRIVKFCNRLFCLDYVHEDDTLYCSLEKITICKQEFNFEIEIADTIVPNCLHLIRQKCEQLIKQDYDCSFSEEQVFGRSEQGKFKLRIFKTL